MVFDVQKLFRNIKNDYCVIRSTLAGTCKCFDTRKIHSVSLMCLVTKICTFLSNMNIVIWEPRLIVTFFDMYHMKHSSSIILCGNLQNYRKKFQIHNFKIKVSPGENNIFHPDLFSWQDIMNLYVRLHTFLSYILATGGNIQGIRVYTSIFSQIL